MFKKVLLTIIAGLLLILGGAFWVMASEPIKLIVNSKTVSTRPAPEIKDDRVLVPVRFIAEELGGLVTWDEENRAVIINQGSRGDRYLKGQNATRQGIANNLLSAQDLKDILDDDKDLDLADYRKNHNGGDNINNDPLVVDIRAEKDYNAGHIPAAVWINTAENMAEEKNIEALKSLLDAHVKQGGKNEVVLYCYTGNTSGLVSGVLGSLGLNVKSMKFGYDIAWAGTKKADPPVKATIEDKDGKVSTCGG